jgi:nitroreductase
VYDGEMDVLPEIMKRISVRDFADKEIPADSMDRILEAGRLAPSAKNRQPWRFVVVRDRQKRKLFEQACFGQEHVGAAPAVIACCSTNTEYRMPNGQLSYPIDISLAASFMMLQAVREGMGTCIVTTFDETIIREILTVPFSMRVVMLLLVGYGKTEAEGEHDRLPTARISSFDHW